MPQPHRPSSPAAIRSGSEPVKNLAYLSLGSNLGDRAANLRAAIAQIASAGSLPAISSFYETEPLHVPRQPWFLNCALALETTLNPRQLLQFILSIEAGMGRLRFRDKGPRKIDIDLVLFGDLIIQQPDLTVPHLQMHMRRFVLEPLAEIAPHARHPVLNKSIRELLASLEGGQIVRRVEDHY